MLKEIRCSLCNGFYNNTEKIPIALNNCTHNVCQACFISFNEEGKCPYDGKPFSFEKIMINKKLFELINHLIENNIINTLAEEEEDEEDKKIKKDKEDKINLKIDLLNEFISVIKTKFFFEDKEQSINDLENQINENNSKIKNDLQNMFKNTKQKYINTKPKEKAANQNLQKNYYQYNIHIINNFKKEIQEIKTKHDNWSNKIAKFMDEITNDLDNIVFSFDKYSEEIDERIKDCEKLSSDINEFNEKFTKLKLKIRNAYIVTSKNGEIQLTFNEKTPGGNIARVNSSESLKPNPNNIAQKLIKTDNGNNTNNNNKNNLTESINSFCFGNDSNINQIIDDENIISWDINDNKVVNDDYLIMPSTINDNNAQNNIKSNNDDDLFTDSFISNVDALGLTDRKMPQKKLTKDRIVFIKNKLKSESINCSGYDIGDEGVKKLLEFMIKNNLELKVNNPSKKGQIKYKELKLSRCGLTNDSLNYIKSLMEVCKNTISHINLSRNYIDINGVSILCSI